MVKGMRLDRMSLSTRHGSFIRSSANGRVDVFAEALADTLLSEYRSSRGPDAIVSESFNDKAYAHRRHASGRN